jgi:hypothetical protein
MSQGIAYFLELRVRLRRSTEGRAIVDRCLQLFVRTQEATDPAALRALEAEIRGLENDLALRFGAPRSATLQ